MERLAKLGSQFSSSLLVFIKLADILLQLQLLTAPQCMSPKPEFVGRKTVEEV